MTYSSKQLDEALYSILEGFNGQGIEDYMRARLCLDAAATCWIKNIEENEHTKVLRLALDDLWSKGWFLFTDLG